MSKLGVTLPVLNNSLMKMPVFARLAEDAGFETAFNYEYFRNPYVGLAAAATSTERIRLGTGVAVAHSRTPFVTANAAADVDELSGGRMILGLGPGSPEVLSAFHGSVCDNPVPRMRDYVGAVRATWDYIVTGKPGTYEGPYFSATFPESSPFGQRPMVRETIPIFLGAARPAMIRLAGEVGDGVIGSVFTPAFVNHLVRPNLAVGASRNGRPPESIDIASETVCCVSTQRSEAMHRARIQVGLYVSHPYVDGIVKLHGLEKEQHLVREALATSGLAGLGSVTDDKLVEAFSITGTPDECRKSLGAYKEALDHVILHTPYVPVLTSEETEDAFRSIVEHLAGS